MFVYVAKWFIYYERQDTNREAYTYETLAHVNKYFNNHYRKFNTIINIIAIMNNDNKQHTDDSRLSRECDSTA